MQPKMNSNSKSPPCQLMNSTKHHASPNIKANIPAKILDDADIDLICDCDDPINKLKNLPLCNKPKNNHRNNLELKMKYTTSKKEATIIESHRVIMPKAIIVPDESTSIISDSEQSGEDRYDKEEYSDYEEACNNNENCNSEKEECENNVDYNSEEKESNDNVDYNSEKEECNDNIKYNSEENKKDKIDNRDGKGKKDKKIFNIKKSILKDNKKINSDNLNIKNKLKPLDEIKQSENNIAYRQKSKSIQVNESTARNCKPDIIPVDDSSTNKIITHKIHKITQGQSQVLRDANLNIKMDFVIDPSLKYNSQRTTPAQPMGYAMPMYYGMPIMGYYPCSYPYQNPMYCAKSETPSQQKVLTFDSNKNMDISIISDKSKTKCESEYTNQINELSLIISKDKHEYKIETSDLNIEPIKAVNN